MRSKYPYTEILNCGSIPLPQQITLLDHIGGFSRDRTNAVLNAIENNALMQQTKIEVIYHNVLDQTITEQYPNLKFKFDGALQNILNLNKFSLYNTHPELSFKNFICSFDGSDHVSRKLLVSILHRFGWFNTNYCSKNFSYSVMQLHGHLLDYVSNDVFYSKFFICNDSDNFSNTINSFGHVRFNHSNNIYNLEHKLTESFLHIVSETMATSYVPFVTEKFLYSVVTRGLFLVYAQPGWHAHLEKYYGFKLYTKLFDYRFDSIQNPVERLVELMTMISKFSMLSTDDWRDLYMLQQDEIEFNYDHYFSGNYLKTLQQYCNE